MNHCAKFVTVLIVKSIMETRYVSTKQQSDKEQQATQYPL